MKILFQCYGENSSEINYDNSVLISSFFFILKIIWITKQYKKDSR